MTVPDFTRRHFVQWALAVPFVTTASQTFAQSDRRPLLTIAVPENPAGLEPAMELSNPGIRVTYSVFDTLIRRDFMGSPDGGGSDLKPHLATSWERKGASELIVTLRQGVKFHNGDEMTSEDVAFTFSEKRMWGDKSDLPEARAYFGVLSACEVRIPTKPAMHSNRKPATYSDLMPATLPCFHRSRSMMFCLSV